MLRGPHVDRVVDIRTIPRSRSNPQFNKDTLPDALAAFDISYEHAAAQNFLCLWLTTDELNEAWYPATAKLVPYLEGDGNRIAIHVDPGFPRRWREEPYYSRIRQWAVFAADNDAQVIVYVKNRAIAVFPNKEIDLGEFGPDDHIMTGELNVPFGRDWGGYIRSAQDIPEDQRDKWVKRGPRD